MDEISRITSVFGELEYRKLSDVQERLLEEALEELRSKRGTYYGVFQTGSGWRLFRRWVRTEVNVHPNITLVLANGGHRLSHRIVIVLDEPQERFLLPYDNVGDFFAFASMLDIQSTYGYATLINFLIPPIGGTGFEHKEPPLAIRNATDALAFGFEFLDEYQAYTQGNNSFWQGRYVQNAKSPFVLTLDTDQTPPLMHITFIDVKPPKRAS